ncbi:hypothetical protein K3495_g3990 [Podosphaera aphanis]|nr:hypothetical protein K3495_g3990 [Podosphaera aphanis]
MSEVQTRPSAHRGRGSARNGRGGYSSRGRGSRPHPNVGAKTNVAPQPVEEEGEVGQLKRAYSSHISTIKEMFPTWTDEDIVLALRDTDGDLELTVERITDGTISQWGEVSNAKKDRSRPKASEAAVEAVVSPDITTQPKASRGGRGGRGRGLDRGRGIDRGRGGRGRGGLASHTSGSAGKRSDIPNSPTDWTAKKSPAPTETSSWESKPRTDKLNGLKTTENRMGNTALNVSTTLLPEGGQKSWATLFAPQAPKKIAEPVVERPAEHSKSEESHKNTVSELKDPIIESPPSETTVETPPEPVLTETSEEDLVPSKDELTENNLEQLPDSSAPVPTITAISTIVSSCDPRDGVSSSPYTNLQQSQPIGIHPASSGYQNSSIKISSSSGRISSYQRRLFDQEEAVRMPGNREVDRAAVQFGAFGLKGSSEDDVDGDREEAETRAQPPQHSPVAPRAALPPVHNHQTTSIPENLPTPKQPAGLPAPTVPTSVSGLPSPAPHSVTSQHTPQTNGQFSQYGRFAQNAPPEKPFDAFNQQGPSAQSPFEGYPNQQAQAQPHAVHSGTISSTPNEYSSYYTSDPQQRNAYNSYYQQQYGTQHQGAHGQDASASQRSYNGYNGPPGENATQYPQTAAHQNQSRYTTTAEGQNSGHNTPNPVAQAPQPGATNHASQPQTAQQPQVPGSYPYGHPYYSSPYYAAYMNQYPGYGAANYPGGPYGAKAGIHQQYHGYGISPGAPYEHTASPVTAAFGVSSLHGRDSALGGLAEYGRAGSAQSAQNPQAIGGSANFATAHDTFGRGTSYQGQGQPQYGSQQGAQQNGDDLKPYSDSKTNNGPNPSLQGGRPGSATNTAPGSSALPPPQSHQASYGGYPAHLQHQGHGIHANQTASQYGTLSGAGGQHQAGAQSHQNSPYGGYPGFGAGNYYGNSQPQQQRGGWGGNYGH